MQGPAGELSGVHIVLVETASVRGFDMIAEMADSGIEVSFVTETLDAHRKNPGFELSARAARIVEVPHLARGVLADRLRGRLGPLPPDGVICRDEVHLPAAAELARDLGLPHESPSAARILSDKAAVRARLTERGIGALAWRVAATAAEGLAAVEEIGLPVVVKPTAGGWSVGVSIAWSRAQAARALAEVLGVPAGPDGTPPRALIEEYAVGRHVSAELLVQDHRTVLLGFAERLPAPPGQTAELGGHFPARIEQEEAARAFVLDAVRAIGVRSSAVHAELLLTPTGPELIEINGRVAGHVVARQMSLALQRSLTADLVALAVGDPVREAAPNESVVALHHLFSPVDAVVRGVKPQDVLTDEVIESHVTAGTGDRVAALRTNHDRIGYVLARGRTGDEAARHAAEAARRILESLELHPVPDTTEAADALPADPKPQNSPTDRPPVPGQSPTDRPPAAGDLRPDRPPIPGESSTGRPPVPGQSSTGRMPAAGDLRPGRPPRQAGEPSGHTPHTPHAPHAPHDAPCGEHVLLLLGAEDPADRIMAALGAVTARVSVIWTSGPDGERRARTRWQHHCRGQWHTASTGPDIRAAARRIHAAEPVRAMLTFSAAHGARQLRDGAPAARPPAAAPTPGHTVVVAAYRGDVRALAVIDEEPGTRLCPSGLDGPSHDELTDRAVHAVRAAHIEGVVRCVLAQDTLRPGPGRPEPVLLPGLDAATIDLYDAVHTRGLVTAVAESALGRAPRARSRPAVALQRAVTTPGGRFRVIEATTEEQLQTFPGLFRAQVFTRAGHVHQDPRPTVWLRHTVVAAGRDQARRTARKLERSLLWRTTAQERTHVLLLDRIGAATWTLDDGTPVLPADRFRLSVLSSTPGPHPADLAVRTDLSDDFLLGHLARTLDAGHPVHRVAALSERLLQPAARLRALLGTAGEGPHEVRRWVDKAVMKRIARSHRIRCADGLLAHTAQDITEMFDRHGKIVLKPRAASGSRGVAVLASWPDLQAWLHTQFTPGTHLCEEFVDAPLCHIDAVVHDGEPVWDVSLYERDTMALRHGLPLSSATVADPALRAAAGRLLDQVLHAWQMDSGVLHLEAFVTGGHLTFCEVAARPGGAGVAEAFRATTGIDLDHAKLLADVGLDPRHRRRDPVAAHAGWTVHYSGGGRLLKFDDSAVAPHAYARSVHARVGDTVPASRFSGSGISTHVFAHDSHAEVSRLLHRAEHDIRIVCAPAPATRSRP
ncbi:ATP-grasp domain-containing protein [Streptomyces europaeiscabiei]|uniref:ATP-grasp domain-containing protein n=1 Tax=Streptomyces europaeiscabiei TaxID=146819 RepID=UPI0029A62529|nr:ATP-grasp domain-containing protein [Streptomyces europaeiscabiei]MDX2531181.1 ATP-grasp domain-containing protein [Streptomyces europaeiscabiei]